MFRQIYKTASVFFVLVCSVVAHAQSWDFANDFTPKANPNSRWAYGYRSSVSTTFNLMNSSGNFSNIDFWYYSGAGSGGLPSIGKNNTAQTQSTWLLPNKAMLHPGDNAATSGLSAVVRWTAPASGSYRVDTLFTTVDTRGPDISAYIFLNDALLYNAEIIGTGSTGRYAKTLNLSAGQNVDFIVGNAGKVGDKNWTQLDAKITAVPAPSALITLFIGAVPGVGVLLRRRRK